MGVMRTAASLFLAFGLALACPAAPLAWLRTGEPGGQDYKGVPYHWLGDAPLRLTIDVPPAGGNALDLLWGSKNDQRGAPSRSTASPVRDAGGYNGFRWQRVGLPAIDGERTSCCCRRPRRRQPSWPRCGWRRPTRRSTSRCPRPSRRISRGAPPSRRWSMDGGSCRQEGLDRLQRAAIHGRQANEALRRCRKYVDGWLAHADPQTGLIPRNLNEEPDFWNGRDSAADNYAFMVLTCALTDRAMFDGRMLDMLRTRDAS